MTEPKGGEPAFPATWLDNERGTQRRLFSDGLTKRELIAAMAMQGIVATVSGPPSISSIAREAVQYADALFEALNRSDSDTSEGTGSEGGKEGREGGERVNQFKIHETLRGIHAHLTVFVRRLPTETWQNAGTIIVDPDQAESLRYVLAASNGDRVPNSTVQWNREP